MTLKINLTLFGINVFVQFALVGLILSKDYSFILKGAIVSDEILAVIESITLLVGGIVAYILIQHQPFYANVVGKVVAAAFSISIIFSIYTIRGLLTLEDFKDSIKLPFDLKLKRNWSFSERFEYLQDILKTEAIPRPANLELRTRETTGMDSVRDLAKDIKQAHAEALRAKPATKDRVIDSVDANSPSVLENISGWVQGHYVEITVGCMVICAIAITVSIFAYLSINNDSGKADKALEKINEELEKVNKSITSLEKQLMSMPSGGDFKTAVFDFNRELNGLTNTAKILETEIVVLKEAIGAASIPNRTSAITSGSGDSFSKFKESLLKMGEHSPSGKPYVSAETALDNLAATVFNNHKRLDTLALEITNNQSKARGLVFKSVDYLEDKINSKLGAIDKITEVLINSKDYSGNSYVSAYEALRNIAETTTNNKVMLFRFFPKISRNEKAIATITSKLDKVIEEIEVVKAVDSASATEQTAAVVNAVLESGI